MKIEGRNPVREILNSGTSVEKITVENGSRDSVIKEIINLAREKNVKIEYVNRSVLDKMSETGHHQGVIAVYSEFKYSELSDVIKKAKNENQEMFFLVLDEIADPHNLGSIIRVAECAGVTAVIIPNRRSATVNETVVRTSAGATAYVPVCKVTNINKAIETLKNENVWVYALDMDGEEIYKSNLTGNIALVVGNEGDGVHDLTRKLCDGVISIPMFGKVNSLNASVSAGIATYEVVRQRTLKK